MVISAAKYNLFSQLKKGTYNSEYSTNKDGLILMIESSIQKILQSQICEGDVHFRTAFFLDGTFSHFLCLILQHDKSSGHQSKTLVFVTKIVWLSMFLGYMFSAAK